MLFFSYFISYNLLISLYRFHASAANGTIIIGIAFTVCKYTKFPNITKQNVRKITEMLQKTSNAPEKT